MFVASVYVTLKAGVNDPQGLTIKGGLRQLGFETVRDVRAGKFFEIRVDEDSETSASKAVDGMCDRLLANKVIEDYRFELERTLDQC